MNDQQFNANAEQLLQVMDYNEKIHLSLIKVKSSQSRQLRGVARRLGEFQSTEQCKDKRFTRGFGLGKLVDLVPSLLLQLHAEYFTLALSSLSIVAGDSRYSYTHADS